MAAHLLSLLDIDFLCSPTKFLYSSLFALSAGVALRAGEPGSLLEFVETAANNNNPNWLYHRHIIPRLTRSAAASFRCGLYHGANEIMDAL